ncbi:MAG: hypothetical protein FWC68_00255 [Oscillospiraceae bacterium]|nr:hypothetical protein [Oscillospiraceae bacterium]
MKPGSPTMRPLQSKHTQGTSITLSNLGELLSKSILNSFNTLLLIGGFIVLFSILISMLTPVLDTLGNYPNGIITGFLELTNGIEFIGKITTRTLSTSIIISSFLIGFGGISVLLQVLSIVSKQNISIKPYIIGKLLQGFFAALYTYLILQNSMLFNFDL